LDDFPGFRPEQQERRVPTKEEIENLAVANARNYPNSPNMESHQGTYDERRIYNDKLAEERRRAEDARRR
jgi:hypothetical protein